MPLGDPLRALLGKSYKEKMWYSKILNLWENSHMLNMDKDSTRQQSKGNILACRAHAQ